MNFKPFAIALALLSIVGAAHAQLQARDINGDGSIDAFFDAQQRLTWLADANYAATSNYSMPTWYPSQPAGQARWTDATAWADQLSVYGVSDWRLPSVILPTEPLQAPSCPILFCSGFVSLESELTRLYDQLGGDFGSFLNVQGTYWTGSYAIPRPLYAQVVNTSSGSSFGTDELDAINALAFAWAVRDGDVSTVTPVPEPSTYALMLAGLAAVAFAAKRRRVTVDHLTA